MDRDIIKSKAYDNNTKSNQNPLYNHEDDYALIKKSKYFNELYYRNINPNIKDDDDAINYFLEHESDEEYPTSKYFNPKWYLNTYKDVKESEINPLIHFLRFGKKEGRLYRYAKCNLDNIPEKYDKELIKTYYDTIYNSLEFDIDYYLKEYDITTDIDPILHYILYGAKKGYNPSNTFNTKEYFDNNPNKVTVNPLYHYIKYRNIEDEKYFKSNNISRKFIHNHNYIQSNNIINQLKSKVSIIIPIYNAYEETKACIESILLNTHINYELILINDCSTDSRINKLLNSLSSIPNITVIENQENQGFVKNVNKGINESEGDVVLLNSDTIVTPKWLSQLIISAYSQNNIATVTPISNSSDITIDSLSLSNDRLFLNKAAYQLKKIFKKGYMESPTGNGFCLYIKREIIEEIGLFDEIFDKGYGEETDFTYKVKENGWMNIRNFSVFVYHKRHASFKAENSEKLKKENKKILSKRYPELYSQWDNFINSEHVNNTIKKINNELKPYKTAETILYVTTIRNGKIDLDKTFYELSNKYDCYILVITQNNISLNIYNNINRIININKWKIKDVHDESFFTELYFNMFISYKFDLIYNRCFDEYRFNRETTNLGYYVRFIKYLEIPLLTEGKLIDYDNLLYACESLLNPDKSLEELIEEKSNYIDFSKKKVVVYTALTGNYDKLITPTVIEDDFDYICFTDNPNLKSDFWQIRQMEKLDLDEVRKARRYKLLPQKYLQEYDYSIWIDTNFDITDSLKEYINKYSKEYKLLAIKHDERDCIYEELEACKRFHKDIPEIMDKQVKRYKKEGYPTHNGLIASGILFRDHHDKEVIQLMEDWYYEIKTGSKRDQLSFNYVCWKNKFKYEESSIYYFKNEYFQRRYHTSKNLKKLEYNPKEINNILDAMDKKTTIIIPIYNAYEQTKTCIESVLEHTNIPYELLLINDCSPDKRIDKLLEYYKNNEKIKIINNKTNQGFVKNINIGHDSTDNDVLWLNSDTIVTPKWLQKLKLTAYSDPKIATVTPLSNNAGAFSVPEIGEKNPIDEKLGINATANIIEKISDNTLIDTPTGNGFCMYVKREAINDVGNLNLEFEEGYGEENDFCMRLKNAGWKNVIDTSTYIIHDESASFGHNKKEKLIKKHLELINLKHPTYNKRVYDFIHSFKYKQVRDNIRKHLNSKNKKQYNRKRILYVIHEGKGGSLYQTVDLMKHLNSAIDVYIVITGKYQIELFKYTALTSDQGLDDEFINNLEKIAHWDLKTKYSLKDIHIEEFSTIYFNIIKALHIDIIHIQHLIRSSLDIPHIAKKLGIPVAITFHDFYYICPSHNLLDNNNEYCGGHCTPMSLKNPNEQCFVSLGLNPPIMKTFVNTWRNYIKEMLECCSLIITPSKSTYNIYTDFYPELINKESQVIEHGRDLKTPENIKIPKYNQDEPIKILIPGNINANKGAVYIKELKKYDVNNKLDLHIIGNVKEAFHLEQVATLHGVYKRSEFCKKVHEIKPHIIGIFSSWPETYCYTLTETWSCGLPVIGRDKGAIGERIKENGGGFIISEDPEEAFNEILDIFNNQEEYVNVINQIPEIKFKTTKEMGEEYLEAYKKLI